MEKENNYYVYVYLDTRKEGNYNYGKYNFKYKPFYIGKGKNNRYLKHLYENEFDTENTFKYRVIKKIRESGKNIIINKIEENLSEENAYILETKLISLIGRRCNNTGCLTNILIINKPPINYIQLNNETINEIIKLYKEGWYMKHIANKLNLNENKIKSILIENKINLKRKPPTNKIILDSNKIENMTNDYNIGMSIRKICNKYNLSFEVVRLRLKNNGVVFRGYDYKKTKEHIEKMIATRKKSNLVGEKSKSYIKISDENKMKIIKLRNEEGLSIKSIAKRVNLKYGKTYNIMVELGLSTKNIKQWGVMH